jgi:hypothetical protein
MLFVLDDKEGALPFLARICGLLRDSCGPTELSWRDPDDAPEMVGELALVGEAGVGGDLRQGRATVMAVLSLLLAFIVIALVHNALRPVAGDMLLPRVTPSGCETVTGPA